LEITLKEQAHTISTLSLQINQKDASIEENKHKMTAIASLLGECSHSLREILAKQEEIQ
jgi:uncharacterized coiled-coil protein SlyX